MDITESDVPFLLSARMTHHLNILHKTHSILDPCWNESN